MLKKTFGILLLIIGLFLENIGVFGIGNTGGQLKTIDGQLQQELFESYHRAHEQSLVIGGGLIAVGFILIIIGLVLLGTKTKAQKEKEMELKLLKSMQESGKV